MWIRGLIKEGTNERQVKIELLVIKKKTVNIWTVWYHSMWVNVSFFGADKNGDGPLKAWTSHKRRCVFVVHNSAYCVALVAVGAALGRGASQKYLRDRCMYAVSGCSPNGFFNTQPWNNAIIVCTRCKLTNQNCLHKSRPNKYENNYQNVIAENKQHCKSHLYSSALHTTAIYEHRHFKVVIPSAMPSHPLARYFWMKVLAIKQQWWRAKVKPQYHPYSK